ARCRGNPAAGAVRSSTRLPSWPRCQHAPGAAPARRDPARMSLVGRVLSAGRDAARATMTRASAKAPDVLTVSPGGPPIGEVTPWTGRSGSGNQPRLSQDTRTLDTAITSALLGRPALLQSIYEDMADRDIRVGAVCRTRLLVLQSRPHSVSPPPEAKGD